MCVGFWSLDHLDYALILCTNRDEYLSRPTENAHFHSFGHGHEGSADDHFVLSGLDLQAGGSWFGINRSGKIALLTNITEPIVPHSLSRGLLVSSFLVPDAADLDTYTEELCANPSADYGGFNMVLFSPLSTPAKGGDTAGAASTGEELPGRQNVTYDAVFVTNSGAGGALTSRPLRSGERRAGGVSNGVDSLDGSDWPKVQTGVACLSRLLFQDAAGTSSSMTEEALVDRLFKILSLESDAKPGNRAQLRNSIHIPPLRITHSLAHDASADGPEYYGTRLSTVLLVRRDGSCLFIERDIWRVEHNHNHGSSDHNNTGGEPTRGSPRDDRVFRFSLSI